MAWGEISNYKIDRNLTLKENFQNFVTELNRERFDCRTDMFNIDSYQPCNELEAFQLFCKFCGRQK